MFARPRGVEDLLDAADELIERRERERLHAEELAAFDQALGLPPEAFLTKREFLQQQNMAPRIPGAIYLGGGEYVWVDHTGQPARFFDDRVKGVTE